MENTIPKKRQRNAAATRMAILESARSLFVRLGYDGVGVREIAKSANVSAMLINRYFGSKEGLFAEVVAQTMARPVIATQENLSSANRAKQMAKALVEITTTGSTALDGFQIMLRSASSDRAAKIACEEIEKHHQRTITASLSGYSAPQRAALILSLVAGVQIMRQVIGLKTLKEADPGELTEFLTLMIQSIIDA